MKFNPKYHNRHSIRLPSHNYSKAGSYFITLCVNNKEEDFFGKITNGNMELNEFGNVVNNFWNDLPGNYLNVELGVFTIMPNHLHGIINFTGVVTGADASSISDSMAIRCSGAIRESPLRELPIHERRVMGLSKIIGRFKMVSAKQINILQNTPGNSVWQRNYYEHIIRNEKSYKNIQEYIFNNSQNWKKDKYY